MYAIKGKRIFTMDEAGIINNGIILVEGDTIRSVGADQPIPPGYTLIDASEDYVFPGFIDSHTHIGLEEEIYGEVGDDVNEATDPITPQLQALDGINLWDLAFTDALRGGVTRAMSMPGSANVLGGQAVFLKSFAGSKAEMIYKNPWGLKAALGENPKRVYKSRKKAPETRMGSAALMREAFYTAARMMDKIETSSSSESFKYLPVIKVLKKEMPLLLHVHRADDILTALRIKDEFHIDMLLQHGTEAALVADELTKRNVGVFLGPLFVNRAKVEMKEVSFKNAALLAEKGVEFSFITDHPVIPVEHLRVCAALTVREGLNEEQALKALTITPARLLNVDAEIGSIAVGKKADLVIYNGHPLDFKSRVKAVLVDGKLWRDQFE
ncbi:MAG: amidohydrolase [Bacillota bacterium]|nr:amidohydrolase [Bacillota bacterium]